MEASWRWFGPEDRISLTEIRETGVRTIVTALHHVPPGEVWTLEEIRKRQALISYTPSNLARMEWGVVESLPVSEDIKRQSGDWRAHVEAWKESLKNLHTAGLRTICYNFMPLLDWTRTELDWPLPNGTTCMRFDRADFAVFDIHVLKRDAADHDDAYREMAARRNGEMSDDERARMVQSILVGLVGDGRMKLEDIKDHLEIYANIGDARLRRNFADFLEMVTPLANELGMRICCHPDDPPFPLLGLPRIVSTEQDLQNILGYVDLPANGITLCTGSLGARPDNDLPGIAERLGDRIHFLHLRNVQRDEDEPGTSFHESGHIEGNVDMAAVIRAILAEEAKRKKAGRSDASIPFRPDHGLSTAADSLRKGQPGYPLVGRHVGLGELNGLIASEARHLESAV